MEERREISCSLGFRQGGLFHDSRHGGEGRFREKAKKPKVSEKKSLDSITHPKEKNREKEKEKVSFF